MATANGSAPPPGGLAAGLLPAPSLTASTSTRNGGCPGQCLLRPIRGALLLSSFIYSTMATTVFFFMPLMVLQPLAPTLTLALFRGAGNAWYGIGALMLESLGVRVRVTSNVPLDTLAADRGRCLVIANHYCRMDWIMLWMLEVRHGWGASKLAILKDDLRHMFGPGWAMQAMRYVFINRNWQKDQSVIRRNLSLVCQDGPVSLLLFPEGTDRSPGNLRRGREFAQKKGLPTYRRVLHPRTKGFCIMAEIMHRANRLSAIWDVTMGYVGLPEGAGEKELASGRWPAEVHFHVRRYSAEEVLPSTTEAGQDAAAEWLKRRWAEKEEELEAFEAARDPGSCGDDGARYGVAKPAASQVVLGAGDITAGGGLSDDTAFPWQRWLLTGAPLYAGFSGAVVPYMLYNYKWARWWGLVGSVASLGVACLPGAARGWDQLLILGRRPRGDAN
jgi:lysocardiolipin and lysophospholipid acyltransferase